MLRRFLDRLVRWYDQQETPTKVSVLAAVLLVLVGLQQLTAARSHRMTRFEAQQLRTEAEQEALKALPQVQAEARRLKEHPRRDLVVVPIDPHTPVTTLPGRTGQATFRIGYADGFFDVEDVRHWESTADPDPIELTSQRHSVAGGSRGDVMVGGCCEGGDARITVVLRAAPPAALPARGFSEVSDMDIDLASGALLFSADIGTQHVVRLAPGSYRMRIAGVGAEEFEQARERFRIELWPRGRDGELQVLRRTRY